jgi:lipooligosaccharide transport system permease protein
MPGWLRGVANALPLVHAVELGRPLLLGRWPEAPLLHLAVLALYAIGGFWVAMVLFRRRLTS